jgi:hypothetical protein
MKKVLLAIASLLIFPLGLIMGIIYIRRGQETRTFGVILLACGIFGLIGFISAQMGEEEAPASQVISSSKAEKSTSSSSVQSGYRKGNPDKADTQIPDNYTSKDRSIRADPTIVYEIKYPSVDLREILDLRDANEVAADTKYIGMSVRMEGKISQIHERDLNIIPLGSGEFQMAGAKCKFDKSQLPDLIELRKGQSLTIVGVIKDISDFMYNELEINPCKF